ncbi:MAG: acyl-CoA dehydrogenase [Tahibacter sp.]
MDFLIDDELQMLEESVRRLVARDYTFSHREQIRQSADGWSRQTWRQLADLGLLSLIVPEEWGGVGAGPIGAMLVSQVLGTGLLLEPFQASALVATHALIQLADAAQRERWLPSMMSGDVTAVFADAEMGDDETRPTLRTRAVREGNGWRLDGSKHMVYHSGSADLLLVSASVADDASGEVALFVVGADTPGVHRQSFRTVDDQRAAFIELTSVRVDADARVGADANVALCATRDFGLAMQCADALGTLERILAATIEYGRTRKQFGVAIGNFQALQHRMVDMYMQVEQARSMACLAACRCAGTDAALRSAAASAAKVAIGQASRFVGQQAVQLHAGMGMSDELDVSHCFRRLTAFELRGGSTDWHLRRYAKLTRLI